VKPWDDLQILRSIDEFEASEPGTLSLGLNLMERMRPGAELDQQNDPLTFARELILAQSAELLTFDEHQYGQPSPYIWHRDPYFWVQRIGNIRLTLAGRALARGRVVITELPDPDQDDGRPISGLTLTEVADSIGQVFTPSQLPTFLTESGIAKEWVSTPVEGTNSDYVKNILVGLHDGGSAARRSLRRFIGAWLSGELHEPPAEEARQVIVEHLGRQGWHVEEGVLVVGEKTTGSGASTSPLYRDARIATLHPQIRAVAKRYLSRESPEVAVFEALKAIVGRVKDETGLDLDGTTLMGEAMSDRDPRVRFGDLNTQTGRDFQAGSRFMFMGAVGSMRNPDAHQSFRELTEEQAFEELSVASLLMRRLDEAVITKSKPD